MLLTPTTEILARAIPHLECGALSLLFRL